jgi:hypothetical protein
LADGNVSLAHIVVHTSRLDLRDEDVVGSTGNGNPLRGNLSEDTDGNARATQTLARVLNDDSGYIPGERVAHHKISVDAQLLAKLPNFVLEHLAKGLNEFQLPTGVS